jgi:hypothetical protein
MCNCKPMRKPANCKQRGVRGRSCPKRAGTIERVRMLLDPVTLALRTRRVGLGQLRTA